MYKFSLFLRYQLKVNIVHFWEQHSLVEKQVLQYTTVNDPNSTEEPTFPQGYAAPKNVLYSPLTDTLKRGYTYTFKIKCDSVNDMVVVDGNNFVHLEKNGDIFSGQVTINGSSGQVNLASYTGRSYSTFYLYRTSR